MRRKFYHSTTASHEFRLESSRGDQRDGKEEMDLQDYDIYRDERDHDAFSTDFSRIAFTTDKSTYIPSYDAYK